MFSCLSFLWNFFDLGIPKKSLGGEGFFPLRNSVRPSMSPKAVAVARASGLFAPVHLVVGASSPKTLLEFDKTKTDRPCRG
jgi:hypothetical protein